MTDRYSGFSYLFNSFTAIVGVLTLQEWALVVGTLLGVLTYLTNLYFKRREDRRQSELHQLKVIAAQEQGGE